MDPEDLVKRLISGDQRALARALSLVEAGAETQQEVMAGLAPHTGGTRVIGLTGAPGVGKSTSTNALVSALRDRGEQVAVLAIDPSSPFTGGALLGDRVRMQDHSGDPGVFIRSMANRGHLGGLSRAAPHAVRVFDAAGFDTVLLETVGVGQAEVAIASLADTTVVLVAPGGGDGVQAAKAGVLEIGDVFVVNKADHDGAHSMVREIREMAARGERDEHQWRPPVLTTVANTGEGIDDVVHRLDQHQEYLRESGEGARRRRSRTRAEVEAITVDRIRSWLHAGPRGERLDSLADDVAEGRIDPYAAVDKLLNAHETRQDSPER